MTNLTASPVDLSVLPVVREPMTYVRHEAYVNPDVYAAASASYPTCPPAQSPTGFAIFPGDPGYDDLLAAQPAWKALHDGFHNQGFIDWVVEQFRDDWKRLGCLIDLDKAVYNDHVESREEKRRFEATDVGLAPHELFVRMDINQGNPGYDRPVHVDHARRLVSMLIYMSDQDEIGMKGGELEILGARRPFRADTPTVVHPTKNLMVAFPCSADSWHAVPEITSTVRPREYLQVAISSTHEAWPRKAGRDTVTSRAVRKARTLTSR